MQIHHISPTLATPRATAPVSQLDLFNQISHSDLGFSQQEQHQMLQQFLPYVVKVRGVENLSRPEPSGLLFVQLAIASGAQVLVTGDAPLLAMTEANALPFQIVAPEPFLHLLRESAIQPAPLRVAPRRSH